MTVNEALEWIRSRYADQDELVEQCRIIISEGEFDEIEPIHLVSIASDRLNETTYANAAQLFEKTFTSE